MTSNGPSKNGLIIVLQFRETAIHVGGFLLLALLRISCTVGAGVIREANRYSEGIMIPRYTKKNLIFHIQICKALFSDTT